MTEVNRLTEEQVESLDSFVLHLRFVSEIRANWQQNRHLCPAYQHIDVCRSQFSSSGICEKERCPILWE